MALRQVPQGLGEAAYALGATDRVISLLSRFAEPQSGFAQQ
jgi:ABC-type phosphate transport system permease subunit